MKLKKRLFTIILISNIGLFSYAQTNEIFVPDTIQQSIKNVENSLSPLVLKKGESLWNLENRMQKYKVSGLSITVVNDYQIEWAKGYGLTGGKEIPNVTEKTVFQAASMSKFVNAVALMKLKESTDINLDDDINTLLTSWKIRYDKKQPISLRQLLSHTAGLSTHGFNGYKDSKKIPSLVQILEGTKPANSDKVRQILPSNKEFRYSGGGTIISQLILMDQSNSSYEDFVSEHLFKPLEMNHSFYSTELNKYPNDLAYGHTEDGKPLKNNYNIYPESAAAGLWTTPTDLAKLIIDIQLSLKNESGKILSHQSSKELIKPTLKNSNAALGLFTEEQNGILYLQHSGSNKGFRGKFYFSSENGNGVVIMVNGTNTTIIDEIIRSVALVYKWAGFEVLQASSELDIENTELRKYVGTYALENREVKVTLKKEQLMLTEKGKWSSNLTALNKSTFVVDIVKPQATIEFVSDSNGAVIKCKLNQGGLTEWTKID